MTRAGAPPLCSGGARTGYSQWMSTKYVLSPAEWFLTETGIVTVPSPPSPFASRAAT